MSRLRVLLTGASGRIGSAFLPAFGERYDLRCFDAKPSFLDPSLVVGDLQDFALMRKICQDRDVVVHLAATPWDLPFLEYLVPNNMIGCYNVFKAAQEEGVRRMIFSSTCLTVHGYPQDGRTIEISDPPRPTGPYAATKLFGEALGQYFHDRHGMEFIGVRIGTFGEYSDENRRINMWFSPRDAVNLFCRAVEKPGIGFAVVFGSSVNSPQRLSLASAREILEFEPQDDVRHHGQE